MAKHAYSGHLSEGNEETRLGKAAKRYGGGYAAAGAHAKKGSGSVVLRGRLARTAVSAGLVCAVAVPLVAVPQISSATQTAQQIEQTAAVTVQGSATKQEVVYAKLSAAGGAKALYVMNAFQGDPAAAVKDFGAYTHVTNLTNGEALGQTSDGVTFSLENGQFSYQGDLPGTDLPWLVGIRYQLDGQDISAEDLAGKSGELTMTIETRQNTAVDAAYFNNYLLQVSCNLPNSHARNVKTDQGSIALAGSDTTVTFMAMPEKQGNFVLSATVENFEMEGISFAAVPFSMAIESPDSSGMISNFDALVSGTKELATGSSSLAAGTEELSQGIGALNSGAQDLNVSAQQLAGGVSSLATGLAQASAGANQLASGSQEFADNLAVAAGQGAQIAGAVSSAAEQSAMVAGIAQNKQVELVAVLGIDGYKALMATNTYLNGSGQTPGAASSLTAYSKGVSELSSAFSSGTSSQPALNSSIQGLASGLAQSSAGAASLSSGMSQFAGGMNTFASSANKLAAGAGQLSSGAQDLAQGTSTLYEESQGIPAAVQSEIDAMMASYDKSDFKPVSFTSSKNTGVTLVQFVMTTDPIKVPEAKAEEPEAKEETVFDRFMALFS